MALKGAAFQKFIKDLEANKVHNAHGTQADTSSDEILARQLQDAEQSASELKVLATQPKRENRSLALMLKKEQEIKLAEAQKEAELQRLQRKTKI